MARDPLRILLSIRRRSVEQARFALSACLAVEAVVADKIRSLDESGQRERETRGGWRDAHLFLEMSAIRVDAERMERRTAVADLAAAEARSGEARGIVSAARTAAEAVQQFIGEREATSHAEAARLEQHALDDIVRSGFAARRRGAAS